MKILILGAGSCQLNAIKRAKKMNHEVIVADYLPDSIGKQYADFSTMTSTFDYAGVLSDAKEFNVDGIFTIGTDQPIKTATYVSNQLNLPSLLSNDTALSVTNKKVMKNKFQENQIPTPPFAFIDASFKSDDIAHITFPAVLKPLDSQGQRGIYKINQPSDILKYINSALSYSQEKQIIIESYYPSDEITISGWVHNNKLYILTVSDRLTFEVNETIGISSGHLFPSKYFDTYYEEINSLSEHIIDCFDINNGPIYFQFLIGSEGLKVNEIACRIGGAFEDEIIPILTGVDILDFHLSSVLNKKINVSPLKNYDIRNMSQHVAVELFFCQPGVIKKMTSLDALEGLPYVYKCHYNYSKGDEIPPLENASQRAGYGIITGSTLADLRKNVDAFYKVLNIEDDSSNNLVIPHEI